FAHYVYADIRITVYVTFELREGLLPESGLTDNEQHNRNKENYIMAASIILPLKKITKTSLTKGSNCPYAYHILAIAYNLLLLGREVTDDLIVVQYAEHFILIPFHFDNLKKLDFEAIQIITIIAHPYPGMMNGQASGMGGLLWKITIIHSPCSGRQGLIPEVFIRPFSEFAILGMLAGDVNEVGP
ncbi:hypothetical protein ACJX0J_040017, partial [Zea mays]